MAPGRTKDGNFVLSSVSSKLSFLNWEVFGSKHRIGMVLYSFAPDSHGIVSWCVGARFGLVSLRCFGNAA